ncbi:MAG: glutathione S-transferase N-terminal domain-containing protein [Candidatus Paceibacterota bacterium]|jgi:glutaredoxin
MLILYTKDGCQHCSLVKQELARMDVSYNERNISNPKNLKGLLKLGGKPQTPFLVDEESGVLMHESMAIIDYLRKTNS